MKHDMSDSGICAACGYTYEEICDDIGPADCPGHRLKAVESFAEIRAHRDRIKREERTALGQRSSGAFVAWPVYEAADEPGDGVALTSATHPDGPGIGVDLDIGDAALVTGEYDDETGLVTFNDKPEPAPAYGDPGVPALPPSYWNSGLELCPCGCGISKAEIERAKRDLKAAGIQVD